MIHVDRAAFPLPEFYHSGDFHRMHQELHKQLGSKAYAAGQSRVHIEHGMIEKAVRGELVELFHNKCAYCEQPLESKANGYIEGQIDRFRPATLYPWLVYTWENLFLACLPCSLNKGQHFPLSDEGSRARDPDGLAAETPLLLDPCSEHPEFMLRYKKSGSVEPDCGLSEREIVRVLATIKILKLNRKELVEQRRKALAGFNMRRFSANEFAWASSASRRNLESIGRQVPFAGMLRQVVSSRILDLQQREEMKSVPDYLEEPLRPELEMGKMQRKMPFKADALEVMGIDLGQFQVGVGEVGETALPDVGEKIEIPAFKPGTPHPDDANLPVNHARVESISIERFKAIQDLAIRPLTAPEEVVLESVQEQEAIESMAGWTTLLGENGSGKSSILQAVALALAGGQIAGMEGLLPPKRFLMRGRRLGRVKLGLTGGETISMKITLRGGFEFESGGEPHGIYVRAYGATRLLPLEIRDAKELEDPEKAKAKAKAKAKERPLPGRVQFTNMFNPYEPLIDAEQWLGDLEEDEFVPARLAIKDLLGFEDEQILDKAGDEILVDGQPLENLSSGYQTLVALACDIMAGLPTGIKDMRYAYGIVLIDELGAHLHPAWKMRIVSRLRKAFPLMQFLTSTHEPLCLRGHSVGEVLKVNREKDGDRTIWVDDDLPSPRRLRVDQLLTSKHFGLDSTIDPSIDRKFTEYYQLLADPTIRPGTKRAQRRDQLSAELQGYGVLGYTRRDQLVYEAIDQYLAEEQARRAGPPEAGETAGGERRERWNKVRNKVADLWRFAEAVGEMADRDQGGGGAGARGGGADR